MDNLSPLKASQKCRAKSANGTPASSLNVNLDGLFAVKLEFMGSKSLGTYFLSVKGVASLRYFGKEVSDVKSYEQATVCVTGKGNDIDVFAIKFDGKKAELVAPKNKPETRTTQVTYPQRGNFTIGRQTR